MKEKDNIVTQFMFYMFNRWNMKEAIQLFGNVLGRHIYEKFVKYQYNIMLWYADIDTDYRDKIVARAVECYKLYGKRR